MVQIGLADSYDRFKPTNRLGSPGFGTAIKSLTDPYPLGGYSGVEIGVANEIIPTTDMAGLGNKSKLQGETSYAQLSFAKGLYYNVDLFVDFVPMGQNEKVSGFGGGFRWGFFEAEYLPVTVSFQATANSTSFQNKINLTTQTLDLIASFNVEDVTLYAGVGPVRSWGVFMGGADGVTDSGNVENEMLSTTRMLAGLAVKFSKVFAALEINRTTEPSYAAKIGVRF